MAATLTATTCQHSEHGRLCDEPAHFRVRRINRKGTAWTPLCPWHARLPREAGRMVIPMPGHRW